MYTLYGYYADDVNIINKKYNRKYDNQFYFSTIQPIIHREVLTQGNIYDVLTYILDLLDKRVISIFNKDNFDDYLADSIVSWGIGPNRLFELSDVSLDDFELSMQANLSMEFKITDTGEIDDNDIEYILSDDIDEYLNQDYLLLAVINDKGERVLFLPKLITSILENYDIRESFLESVKNNYTINTLDENILYRRRKTKEYVTYDYRFPKYKHLVKDNIKPETQKYIRDNFNIYIDNRRDMKKLQSLEHDDFYKYHKNYKNHNKRFSRKTIRKDYYDMSDWYVDDSEEFI